MAVRAIRKTIVARVFVMLVRPNGDSVTKLIRGIKNYTFPCADSTQSFRLGLASMSDRNGAQACMPLVHHKNASRRALETSHCRVSSERPVLPKSRYGFRRETRLLGRLGGPRSRQSR